jgi:two-component system sensor histidine kinase KdpD
MASKCVSPGPVTSLDCRQGRFLRFRQNQSKSSPSSEKFAAAFLARFLRLFGPYGVGLTVIFLITLLYQRGISVKTTTVGFTFLVAILSASALWGLGVSVAMSVAAALALDYFFLPPIGLLTISDPQDWVALASFLVTSILGSSLSEHARRQAVQSDRRRVEVERLHKFSQSLLATGSQTELFIAIPQRIIESFAVNAAALYVSKKQAVYRAGIDVPQLNDDRMKVAATGVEMNTEVLRGAWFAPLRLGVNEIGSVGILGPALSTETLDALEYLIAVTIERAHAIEHVGKMEAARECEKLKSVVLDAITHDFRTPLTCIKASVTGLLTDLEFDREQQKDLLVIIDEECDRINHLVGKASEMARVESGEVKLCPAPFSIGELLSTALADCKGVSRARPIYFEVKHKKLQVLADLPLARTVLAHLITNADLYSSAGQPITLSTEVKDGFAFFSVADRGPGIEEKEAARIFEKFYRGGQRFRVDGTGMGLPIARAIVEAHGGTIGVASRSGYGCVFTFSLPIFPNSNSSSVSSATALAIDDQA